MKNALTDDRSVVDEFRKALEQNGWTDDLIRRASVGDFLGDVRLALLGLAKIVPNQHRQIVVDYSMTWEAILAAADFGWKSAKITAEAFPITGTGKTKLETEEFWFNWGISSEKAKQEIRNADPDNPWEPAKTEHTLAYGAQHPAQQLKYPIIGLGSVAQLGSRRFVLRLYRGGADRFLFLYLNDWDAGWGPFCRFLAVRKPRAKNPQHEIDNP